MKQNHPGANNEIKQTEGKESEPTLGSSEWRYPYRTQNCKGSYNRADVIKADCNQV